MENKVFYGEYSLEHWVKLMKNGNIILPEYQRRFVWSEKDVEELIEAFENNYFIPPVLIASKTDGEKTDNIIIDGQQRLTSLLLASEGVFPIQKKDKMAEEEDFADPNDNPTDDEDERRYIDGWNFMDLIRPGKESPPNTIDYRELNSKCIKIFDNIKKERFLGFSYIVPKQNESIKNQQKYFSYLFRNINTKGKDLDDLESRKAMYWLNKDKFKFFEPDFVKLIKVIDNNKKPRKVDFVRYLSLLSQYKHKYDEKENPNPKIAIGARGKMEEKIYIRYVEAEINEAAEDFYLISKGFDKNDGKTSDKLSKTWKCLGLNEEEYPSIIKVDLALFGFLYWILFETKDVKDVDMSIRDRINKQYEEYKKDGQHTRNPDMLKFLRDRIKESIMIYRDYVE